MTDILRCCSSQSLNQPYIGVDQKCNLPAIFCIQHNPHKNNQGLMHQMLPLKYFKKTLQQKKFIMNQKIATLIDKYNNLMDALIQQIRQLKLRKNIQLSMLWLRQLSKDQQQYQLMRQIYRMDFKDLSCSLIHSIYFKIVHNQILQKKTVKDIDCYKSISQILDKFSQQRQTRLFLSKKILQIEGILQNGQILKRALPDKLVFKENIKEVLLESPHSSNLQIKYNKCKLIRSSRQYISIFSKYPLISHLVYHINFNTKYTNIMLGVCTQNLILRSKRTQSAIQIYQNQQSRISANQPSDITQFDKHYSKQSIVFNCTNGCIYKDGMFQSGSSLLTKSQKQLVLKLKIISNNQLVIMLGKNLLCRQKIDNLISGDQSNQKLFLHVLMRTQGDSFEVDRDKDVSADGVKSTQQQKNFQSQQIQPQNLRMNINFQELKRRNQEQTMNINNVRQQIIHRMHSGQLDNQKNANSYKNYNKLYLKNLVTLTEHQSSLPSILPDTKSQQNFRQIQANPNIKVTQSKHNYINKQQTKKQNLLDFNEGDKQKKINQLIKRERIDKILNDIKTKPGPISGSNTVVAQKLKQIKQKNSNKPTPAWRTNIQSQTNSNNQQESFINQRRQRIQQNKKSIYTQQSSQLYPPQPVLKQSYNINPLLIIKKHKQQKDQNMLSGLHSGVSMGAFTNFPSMNLKSQLTSQKQPSPKIKPQQKYFRLQQDESYDFENITQGYQTYRIGNGGNFTPIDNIHDFQFAKKSMNLRPAMDRHQLFKPVQRKYQTHKYDSSFQEGQSSQINLHHSGSFNQHQKSQIIETHQAQNMKPKMGLQYKMPQLQHSRFSKIQSKSNLQDNCHLQSSFGGNRMFINPNPSVSQKSNDKIQNPMNRMNLLQSIINIKSDYSNNETVKMGTIISPKNIDKKVMFLASQSSQIFQESFQMAGLNQQEMYPTYKITGIRGTTK